MSGKRQQSCSDGDYNTCVVCFKNVDIFSIGDCDHPVCYECSTRMRVLCGQNECPICRRDLPRVIFSREVQPFQKIKAKAFATNLLDKKLGIHFLSADLEEAYQKLLVHHCLICKDEIESFRTFHLLKEHMRRQHEVFYCDLCVANLKIFSFERQFYNRKKLAEHRRTGDPDDKSHKGHPNCEFCDTRYMDSDELFRHLRRDHLYCHFCDADGKHHYYSSYNDLRQHFRTEHFLCVEGDCKNEQFTSVFRTEIDLKAHTASIHGRQLGKAGTKQARTLELEFRLAPRPREQPAQNQRSVRVPPPQTLGQHLNYPGVILDNPTWSDEEEGAIGYHPELSNDKRINALDPELFPSLGGAPTPLPSSIASKPLTRSSGNGITIRHFKNSHGLARNDENFPALSGEVPAPGPPTTLRFSLNSAPTKGPNVSIHVNHRPASVTARVTTEPKPPPSEAFPTLGGSSSPVQPAQWISARKPKKTPPPPQPTVPKQNFTDKKDFPTLAKSSKTVNLAPSKTTVTTKKSTASTKSTKNDEVSTKVSPLIPKSSKNASLSVANMSGSQKSMGNSWGSDQEDDDVNRVKKKTKKKGAKNSTKDLIDEVPVKNVDSALEKKIQTVERKKTELNIGNLKTPPPAINGTNFPVLGSGKKPPGFDSWPSIQPPKNPPPGFKQPPPPGFNNTIDLIAAQSAADLTFTNSSGQKYSILPAETNNNFHAPVNFQQRNKKLIENFMTALSDSDLNEFRQYSHLFKQGSYSAKNYYDYCKKCLGLQFELIFPELLALLPDIRRQQELYELYKVNKKCKKQLDVCAICGQVVTLSDLNQHVSSHTLDNHFPVLSGATSSEIATAWKK